MSEPVPVEIAELIRREADQQRRWLHDMARLTRAYVRGATIDYLRDRKADLLQHLTDETSDPSAEDAQTEID